MAKISSLVQKLKNSDVLAHLSQTVIIEPGSSFTWQHPTHTITYDAHDPNAGPLLLHEVGHALLDHRGYAHDVHLLEMERAAWDKARTIAPQFGVSVPDDLIEESLDTYRDWLHDRSVCPRCGSTGVQGEYRHYTCLACHDEWHANEARTCQLRRYHSKKRP